MDNIILETRSLTKSYSGIIALKDFDLQIKRGEIHALLGENGAGKSTLIQALVGAHRPDYGEILLEGKSVKFSSPVEANALGISAVFQELSVVDNLSIAENIFINRQPSKNGIVDFKGLNRAAQELMDRLGICDLDPTTLVGALSPANKQQVEILKAISYNPKVLILDEPTSSLTETEVQMLFRNMRELKRQGVSLIYISHHMNEIFEIADRITIMRDGEKVCEVDTDKVDEKYLISQMVGREIGDIYSARGDDPIGEKRVLEVRNLSCAGKFRDVSFHINEGEIVAFAGLVGAGRTEVGMAIFGVDKPDAGTILLNGKETKINSPTEAMKLGIGYVSEDRKQQGLFLDHSIRMNLSSNKISRFSHGGIVSDVEITRNGGKLRKLFNIVSKSLDQKVGSLSGGNQQKTLLANWFDINPSLLIIDEPTRGVDVGAKNEIYLKIRELARTGTATMLISSDLMEVLGMADRIYVMRDGRISGELNGREANEEAVLSLAMVSE